MHHRGSHTAAVASTLSTRFMCYCIYGICRGSNGTQLRKDKICKISFALKWKFRFLEHKDQNLCNFILEHILGLVGLEIQNVYIQKEEVFVYLVLRLHFCFQISVTKLNCSTIFIHTLPNPRTQMITGIKVSHSTHNWKQKFAIKWLIGKQSWQHIHILHLQLRPSAFHVCCLRRSYNFLGSRNNLIDKFAGHVSPLALLHACKLVVTDAIMTTTIMQRIAIMIVVASD